MVAVVSSDDTVRARRVPVLAAFVAEAACRVMFVVVAVRARAAFWTVLVAARVRAVWGAMVVAVRDVRVAVAARVVVAALRVVVDFSARPVVLRSVTVFAVPRPVDWAVRFVVSRLAVLDSRRAVLPARDADVFRAFDCTRAELTAARFVVLSS